MYICFWHANMYSIRGPAPHHKSQLLDKVTGCIYYHSHVLVHPGDKYRYTYPSTALCTTYGVHTQHQSSSREHKKKHFIIHVVRGGIFSFKNLGGKNFKLSPTKMSVYNNKNKSHFRPFYNKKLKGLCAHFRRWLVKSSGKRRSKWMLRFIYM